MNEPMKVLHVINIGGYGGAEKLLLQLLPALNQHSQTECWIAYQQANSEAALRIAGELKSMGVAITTHAYTKVYEKGIFKTLQQKITGGQYDLIHSHLKQADFWLAVLKFRRRIDVPVVSTMHSYTDRYENKYGFNVTPKIYLTPYYQVTRWIYRQLDGFILISDIVSRFFQQVSLLKGKKKAIIHHGYEQKEILPVPLPPSQVRIALPGRLIRRKGHDYAIEAFGKIRKQYPEATLHFYGMGVREEELKKKVQEAGLQEHIIFEGYQHNLLAELQKASVIWMPSLWEAFGLVFLDGFAAGVPVVAFDLAAGNEIVQHEVNGLLATPYSAEDLAQQTLRLLADPPLRERIVMGGRKALNEQFNMEGMTRKYLDFYQQVIKAGHE